MIKLPLLLLLLGSAACRVVGFASRSSSSSSSSCRVRIDGPSYSSSSSSRLRDSLFDEIFDGRNYEVQQQQQQQDEEATEEERRVVPRDHSSSSKKKKQKKPEEYNDDVPPFSDSEGPRDRTRRMEMARELQKLFYKEPGRGDDGGGSSSSMSVVAKPASTTTGATGGPSTPNNYLPCGSSTALRDLPTLTSHDCDGIEGADGHSILPGYQFVWKVRNPRICHAFHAILAGPAPWLFAHVCLPTTTTPPPSPASSASSRSSNDASANGEKEKVAVVDDGVASHRELRELLLASNGGDDDPTLCGTLLRITDRRFHDEDGSIVLAVQAIDRLRIHRVSSSLPGTLCLRTDVQLAPEEELMRSHYDSALLSSASYLSSSCSSGTGEEEGARFSASASAVSGAARAAASADASRVRKFEFAPLFLEEKPRRPSSADSLRTNSEKDSGATRIVKDAIRRREREREASGPEYVEPRQLVDYDHFSCSSLGGEEAATASALRDYWERLAKETSTKDRNEDDLFADGSVGGSSRVSSSFLPEPPSSYNDPPISPEAALTMEYRVWCTIDETMRLLSLAASTAVPLPSQLLGLLPKRNDWPRDFALEDRTAARSPSSLGSSSAATARVDRHASYPPLRRAARLSHAIWLLLDGLAVTGSLPAPPSRREVLGMRSVEERLGAADRTLGGINSVLRKMIPEDDGSDEEGTR